MTQRHRDCMPTTSSYLNVALVAILFFIELEEQYVYRYTSDMTARCCAQQSQGERAVHREGAPQRTERGLFFDRVAFRSRYRWSGGIQAVDTGFRLGGRGRREVVHPSHV